MGQPSMAEGTSGHAHIAKTLQQGDRLDFGGTTIEVIATPGHTLDMLNYYLPDQKVCFTGDTLFSLGCGRIFEGDAAMMWNSLSKLIALPADTTIYSSHEYTKQMRNSPNHCPDNAALIARYANVTKACQKPANRASLLSEGWPPARFCAHLIQLFVRI